MSTSKKSKSNMGNQSRVGASKLQSRYGAGPRSIYGTSRQGLSQAGGRRGPPVPEQTWKPPVTVRDESGQDVTPMPLTHHDPEQAQRKGNLLADSTVTATVATDLLSNSSMYQGGSNTASQFGGGPFTRSVLSQSDDESDIAESLGATTGQGAEIAASIPDMQHVGTEPAEELDEKQLEKQVTLRLTETDTIWMLDLTSTCVQTDDAELAAIKERNERYQNLLKTKAASDVYQDRGMNTFNEPPKLKLIQTERIGFNDVGITATMWDMFDSFEAQKLSEMQGEDGELGADDVLPGKEKSKPQDGDQSISKAEAGSQADVQQTKKSVLSSAADTESIFATKSSAIVSVQEENVDLTDTILGSEKFREDLFNMERVLNLNTYQDQLAKYRDLPVILEEKLTEEEIKAREILKDTGPNVESLMNCECSVTKGKNVSCLSWNKENPDLFAVGYGEFEYNEQKPGLVACWSLKNTEFPERIFRCNAGVTAIDFSRVNPNVVAVGLYDGSISIYNVRYEKDESLLDSFSSPGKHTGPVWQLRWIERERGSKENMAEILVSISSDGRVAQWSLRKGFECYELMRLKRSPHRVLHVQPGGKPAGAKERKSEALICRYAGGFCFDFHKNESNIYLAGTEEGLIYRCSCSYNEQYLDAYQGHTGPIYRIQWNPYCEDVFLSCGGDWSTRLWITDRTIPVLTFNNATEYVYDICWSPHSSTVFAAVAEKQLEVWDLSMSTLDPVYKFEVKNLPVELRTVSFAQNADCILVGDDSGTVYVLKYINIPAPKDQEKALRSIIKATLASQLQNLKDQKTENEEITEE